VVFNKQHVLIVQLVIIIHVVVHLNASYVHQDIIVPMLVQILFLVQQEQQLINMAKHYVHHAVMVIIPILLVQQLATYVQPVVNATMQLFYQLIAR